LRPPCDRFCTAIENIVPAIFAWTIRRLLPPCHWYRAAFQISRVLAPAGRLRLRLAWNGSLAQAILLNRMLALLTRTGRAFPVPWKAHGLDLVSAHMGQSGGVVLCSAHLPLVKVACRALMDCGIPVAAAITDHPAVIDSIAIWGRTDGMPAVRAGPHVLVRARTLLRAGKAVLLLADAKPGRRFSPHMLQLARRLDSTVVLFSTDLGRDGVILVRFFAAAGPTVESQLEELRCEVERIRLRQALREEDAATDAGLLCETAANSSETR
jgi:hypothetical protein